MIEIKELCKSFSTENGTVEALKDVNLTIHDGDIFGIIGMSGAGKSTLVRCINMLERPTSGQILINGVDMANLHGAALREQRRKMTMIFQGFHLLMQRNCLKNVCFPMELCNMGHAAAKKRAMELLELVGLPDKATAYPAQLSGGQQQRIAIARALATDPHILLCDEATSALDPKTTHSILELIRDINKRLGITVIVITHQMQVVEDVCSHVAILDEGCVAECGEVSEVFTNPKSRAARALVFPDGETPVQNVMPAGQRLRVVFNGGSAAEIPLIAKMAMECGIPASILSASTRSIEKRAYGSMLLNIPGDKETMKRAMAYLRSFENVSVQEVNEA